MATPSSTATPHFNWKTSRGELSIESAGTTQFSNIVRAALLTSKYFTSGSDGTEVTEIWLEALGLLQYAPAFRSQNVTGSTLLSLNSSELRRTLGVASMKHRRLILNGIHYLQQTLSEDHRAALPEDGRILTHLIAERVLLGWVSFGVTLQMVALATIRLLQVEKNAKVAFVVAVSVILELLAFFVVCHATYQHVRMERMVEKPDEDFFDGYFPKVMPFVLVVSFIVICFYAIVSQNIEDAVIVAMLSA